MILRIRTTDEVYSWSQRAASELRVQTQVVATDTVAGATPEMSYSAVVTHKQRAHQRQEGVYPMRPGATLEAGVVVKQYPDDLMRQHLLLSCLVAPGSYGVRLDGFYSHVVVGPSLLVTLADLMNGSNFPARVLFKNPWWQQANRYDLCSDGLFMTEGEFAYRVLKLYGSSDLFESSIDLGTAERFFAWVPLDCVLEFGRGFCGAMSPHLRTLITLL